MIPSLEPRDHDRPSVDEAPRASTVSVASAGLSARDPLPRGHNAWRSHCEVVVQPPAARGPRPPGFSPRRDHIPASLTMKILPGRHHSSRANHSRHQDLHLSATAPGAIQLCLPQRVCLPDCATFPANRT
jgi:hypothetical protein